MLQNIWRANPLTRLQPLKGRFCHNNSTREEKYIDNRNRHPTDLFILIYISLAIFLDPFSKAQNFDIPRCRCIPGGSQCGGDGESSRGLGLSRWSNHQPPGTAIVEKSRLKRVDKKRANTKITIQDPADNATNSHLSNKPSYITKVPHSEINLSHVALISDI